MDAPLISVVMTAYNAEKFIRKSIESVLNQTYENLQFIIVNDGSTDSTEAIVSEFSDSRIEYYSLGENCHIAHATNVGFSKVKGEYIAIIDSDDIWDADKLKKQLEYLRQHPRHQGCFTWVTLIDEQGHVIDDKMPELKKLYSSSTESREYWLRFFFFYGNRLNNPSSLVTYEAFSQIGRHSLFYIQGMDFEWWVRFAKRYSFGILEESLVYYRRVSDPEVNVSSDSEMHNIRFFNEHMFIRYHFFDDMDDELFLRAFQEMFVCPDSRSPEELACEKAFLLCRPIHGSHCPQALGLLKLEEMLADEQFSKLLKEKYNFSTIECGKYTGQHIFNDLYTQKYEEKIRGQEHWLNLTRQHIFKLENELEDYRRQIRERERETAQLREEISMRDSLIQILAVDLNTILSSARWKLTAPVRAIIDKMKKMVRKQD